MDKSIEELLAEAGDNYMAWYEGLSNMKLKDSE
jgi:hypothetical protein